MKKAITYLVMAGLSGFAIASEQDTKPTESLTLIEALQINKEEDVVKAQLPDHRHKDIKIVGRYKISPLKKKDKLVQIVWTAVANEKNKTVPFDHPLVSVMKVKLKELSKNQIPAGMKIRFTGDGQEILNAIEKLQKGGAQQEAIIKDVKNPQSNERHVLVAQHDKQSNGVKNKSSKNGEEQAGAEESLTFDNQGASEKGQSSYSNTNSPRLPHELTGHSYRSPIEGLTSSMNAQSIEKREKKKDQSNSSSNNQGTVYLHPLSPVIIPQQNYQHRESQRNAELDNRFSRSNPGNSRTDEQQTHNPKDLLWNLSRSQQNGEDHRREKPGIENISHQEAEAAEELVTIYEQCPPRIDELQDRVTLQEKAIIKRGNEVVRETPCQDTFETFIIKRDYASRDCEDRIDYIGRVAHSRYRKYWVDQHGQRHELNDRLYVEEDNPHPFIEERGQCTASINLGSRKAHPQIQTVYYGRGNKRIVIENCHDDLKAQSVDIVKTDAQCTPVHFLDLNVSKERKRDIYILDHVEHEVTPCHEVGDLIPHQFDPSSPCKAIKNLADRSLIHMGKRYITLPKGKRVDISSHCEPYGSPVALNFTTEGCVGYHHDFTANQSYALGRWYYLNRNQKQCVSKCIPGGEALAHHFENVGYKHIDQQKISYPIYKIWVKTDTAEVVLKERQTRPDRGQYAYTLNREETIPYKTPRLEGRALITPLATYKVYIRQDNSEYKEFIKDAGIKREEIPQTHVIVEQKAPVIAARPPQEITERRNAYEYTIDSFSSLDGKQFKCTHVEIADNPAPKFSKTGPWGCHPVDVFGHIEHYCYIYQKPCVQIRKKIITSDGKETLTPWTVESVGKNYAGYCYIQSGTTYYSTQPCMYPGGDKNNPHIPLQPNRVN